MQTGNFAVETRADGYALLTCNAATHGINPAFYRKFPCDRVKDFAPTPHIGSIPNVAKGNSWYICCLRLIASAGWWRAPGVQTQAAVRK
jgi:hypothetical protein